MSLEKVVYTAKAKATGGRDGRATSSDGVLDVKLGVPKEMGGMGGGTSLMDILGSLLGAGGSGQPQDQAQGQRQTSAHHARKPSFQCRRPAITSTS